MENTMANLELSGEEVHGTDEQSKEMEFLQACETGDFERVKHFLDVNPELVKAKDSDGYTPLHRACYENHSKVAQLLLENRADIAAQTNEHWQPLHSACRWNSSTCVTLLLDYGADINALTKGGLTPLHLAASHSTAFETLHILLSHPLIDPLIKSSTGEIALEISQRSGRLSKLFSIVDPAINKI